MAFNPIDPLVQDCVLTKRVQESIRVAMFEIFGVEADQQLSPLVGAVMDQGCAVVFFQSRFAADQHWTAAWIYGCRMNLLPQSLGITAVSRHSPPDLTHHMGSQRHQLGFAISHVLRWC